MRQRAKEKVEQPKLGEYAQSALAAQGIDVSLEQAASLAIALLRLAERGLLVPVEASGSIVEGSTANSPLDQGVGVET